MQDTLRLFSIQHELGMAIGLDLRLQSMLQKFTRICIRRMGLASVHFYFLKNNKTGELHLQAGKNTSLDHYLSIPEENGEKYGNLLPDCVHDFWNNSKDDYLIQQISEQTWRYYYRLSGFGIIVLEQLKNPIDNPILELLKPIVERLAISCQASIEHEQLLAAIEGRKKAEQTIVHQLYHDDLTQLPNRRKLMEVLSKDISRCQRHHYHGAILFIDLDRFKTVNDTLGHSAGDELLKSVAKMLSNIVRREDTVARLSGDEFVIMLTELDKDKNVSARKVNNIVDKIRNAFSQSVIAGEHILHITPSIGIEVYPGDNLTTDQVLRHADTAMYQAKAHGPNSAFFYDQNMSSELESRLVIEKELQDAIKSFNQFQLYYQPQCSYNHKLIGAEALIRWHHPERGLVPPSLFIPVAEETGLMIDVGRWVTQTACKQIREMEQLGLPNTFSKLSINVSAVQFNQNGFADEFIEIVRDSGINPQHIGIELTESTLIKSIEETIDKMHFLRRHHINFSIDDFGTGYSSLSYLSRFPLDTLKIDQAFVRNINTDVGNRAIVETIIALSRSLELNTIAEGVETGEELQCLNALKCKNYQGYYFSKPVPFTEFQDRLAPQVTA